MMFCRIKVTIISFKELIDLFNFAIANLEVAPKPEIGWSEVGGTGRPQDCPVPPDPQARELPVQPQPGVDRPVWVSAVLV